jgi:hypothetical protein
MRDDASVEEGRLVELPTPDASGIERRAFGEFVSRRGELASYAFGWTTGADPHRARFTVGIGAGNPGGATFHAAVFPTEDSYAFGLVDEPFEDVPEGGPHIGADEARAHDTLPFIWMVADYVMARDRRAWWMRHWLLRTSAIQTPEVFERKEPVLLVVNDADDDLWQLLGSSDAADDEAKIGHLYHHVDEDPTLIDVLDLEPGEEAERDRVGGPWTRRSSA